MKIDKTLMQALLNAGKAKTIEKVELIQELWSGYGRLERVSFDVGSIILKLIKPPKEQDHPRGWNNNLSHQRKLKSYEVERNWYRDYNSPIEGAKLPTLLAAGKLDHGEQYIILEDLFSHGFKTKSEINNEEIKRCLKWLANFHRQFLAIKPKGLWEVGTYWHLATRPDELDALDDLKLKDAAALIDQKLNQAQHQTIVHGDAKLANFLFNHNGVAAVDFQYIGGGVGVKDVAYFLSSIFYEDELEARSEECLNYYFKELNHADVEEEWRKLYPWAWSDFYRFLKGWAPGHYKLNSYSEKMKDQVLSCL